MPVHATKQKIQFPEMVNPVRSTSNSWYLPLILNFDIHAIFRVVKFCLFVSIFCLFVKAVQLHQMCETLVHWKLKWNRKRRRQSNKRCIMESEKSFFHNFLVKMNNAGLCLVVPGADSIQTWNFALVRSKSVKFWAIAHLWQCHSVTVWHSTIEEKTVTLHT